MSQRKSPEASDDSKRTMLRNTSSLTGEVLEMLRSLGEEADVEGVRDLINDITGQGTGTAAALAGITTVDQLMARLALRSPPHSPRTGRAPGAAAAPDPTASEHEAVLREAFRVFDKDRKGYITKQEVRQVMASLGESLTDEEVTALLAHANIRDAQITCNDFVKLLS
eukprot:gnl/Spiro4/14346_TR7720_c0_g1_i1.p1 gnl/Spiro4/14346_TR7720_c0_g1~~gnl/Spiro4/14346_TR7720_c0_g1_i1.p1  ORF type:complete len:185 (+),score=60.69 gnl/Spiro4/14346_TR7720_c0_g1_i1:52-555(+)